MKLPCRLAHSVISGSNRAGATSAASRAASNAPDQQRQREDVGSDEEMAKNQCAAKHRRDQRRVRLAMAQQKPGEDRHRRAEAGRPQQDQPAPPGSTIDRRQHDFRQPFMPHPARARQRVREWIAYRQREMGQDPAAGGDVEISVGVV
jgi:hypothetical protein